VANRYRIPFIIAEAWHDDITKKNYPYVFRAGPCNSGVVNDNIIGFVKAYKFKKVAIFAENTDWGLGIKGLAEAALKKSGVEFMTIITERKSQDHYAELNKVRKFKPDLILAGRIALDHVDPYGKTDEVPSTYLIFTGGNNSVRGFPKDGLGPRDLAGSPRGATTRILGNLEVRFPIYRLVHGVAFLDVGSLTDGFEQVGFDTFRWSAGAGLRLHTPVGPIRLEYGYQLQENPPLNRGELHFALGFPF